MLPNFVCPGAARSATTALYYLLIQHPQVFLPSIKETRFFSRDFNKGLDWYEKKYYETVADETAIGDISPVYLVDERCPQRISDALGSDIKLIFMLRDPVDRAYSHYCMLRNHQFEDLSFEDAIAVDGQERIDKSLKYYEHEYGFQYLRESTYSQAIERFWEYFAKDQIKYVIFEEFIDDMETHLVEILGFLDLDQDFKFNLAVYLNPKTASGSSKLNQVFYNTSLLKKTRDFIQSKTGWRTQSLLKKLKTSLLKGRGGSEMPQLEDGTRRDLYEHFKDETARLETMIGKDLSVWRKN